MPAMQRWPAARRCLRASVKFGMSSKQRSNVRTLRSGTVTFLFTDIEGSTRLWETQREAMTTALERHDALLRQCIESRGGHIFKTVGDAFCATFATARARSMPHSPRN